MTASRASAAAGGLLALGLAACATPAPTPHGSALEPLPLVGTRVPDEPDLLARDLATAALAEPRLADPALLERLEALDRERAAAGEAPTGLVPVAADLVNATVGDPIAYRHAAEGLLARDDLSPTLRTRLKASVDDDPLRLADQRLRENRIKDTADVFNALVAPLSKAALTPLLAGVGLARSLVGLVLSERMEDKLEFRERQALTHWKHFLDQYPAAPEAPEIARRTEATQLRWNETRRDRDLRVAREALRREKWGAALVLADRAERYWPEDSEALAIRERAAGELSRQHAERARSLEADPRAAEIDALPGARELCVALLLPGSDLEGVAEGVLERDRDGPLSDEARFSLALARSESPVRARDEDSSWTVLADVAHDDPRRASMARHASALLASPTENPWAAFRRARARDRLDKVRWVMLGPMARGPRRRDLPRPVEWLIDLPSLLQSVASFPNRLVQYAWLDPWPFGSRTAVHAQRYLALRQGGAHSSEVADWLEGWHGDRGNWIAAWEVATGEAAPEASVTRLRARAARQALEGAERQKRGDLRLSLLRQVAQTFEGTDAGREAADEARKQLMEATSQRIRISRGFLLENPRVAGPEGLALRPELLDGDKSNGELHPDGVVLAGGRILEFHYVGESGSDRQPSTMRRQRVSQERLARLVALLDETALTNYLEDPGDTLGPDAGRDLFFERVRLGLADQPDLRPGARSTYAFVGLRERYGLVRGREPILPFDIVFSGSLPSMSFGIYPRMREPRRTPDAILYQ